MNPLRNRLLSTTVLPLVIGVGVGIGGVTLTTDPGPAAGWHGAANVAQNPCAAKTVARLAPATARQSANLATVFIAPQPLRSGLG